MTEGSFLEAFKTPYEFNDNIASEMSEESQECETSYTLDHIFQSTNASTSRDVLTNYKFKKIKRESSKMQIDDTLVKLLESEESSKMMLKEMAEERKKESAQDREIMQKHSHFLSLTTVFMKNTLKEKDYLLPENTFENTYDSGFNRSIDENEYNLKINVNSNTNMMERSTKTPALQTIAVQNTSENSYSLNQVTRSSKQFNNHQKSKESTFASNYSNTEEPSAKRKFVQKFPIYSSLPKSKQPFSNDEDTVDEENQCDSQEFSDHLFTSLLEGSDTENEKLKEKMKIAESISKQKSDTTGNKNKLWRF